MDVSKKRSGGNVQSASPKKQKIVSKKGSSSKGKPKDEDKPKRPPSAYLLFAKQFRSNLNAENENGGEKSTKIGDVSKAAGAVWTKMTDKEKKPFVEEYQEAKAAYDVKMKEFKPAKDENKPKRPMTGFLLFLGEQRPKLQAEGLTGPKVSKRAGELWRGMSDGEKKKYIDQQQELKAKYDEDMKEYLKTNPPQPKQKVKQASKAKVPVESESEEDDDEEEDDDDDDEDEEEEESD